MAEARHRRSLMDLPDELLLMVASNLYAIRSLEPQAQAFKCKAKEKSRQCENDQRKKALYTLSLTCRRLNVVFHPALYSSFISATTWRGLQQMRQFCETLKAKPTYANNVQYIENRLSDYLGNGLYDDLELCGAEDMVQEYFESLAYVIHRSLNLVDLSVVSLESSDVTLWGHLLRGNDSLAKPLPPTKFPKLESLCLQIHEQTTRYIDLPNWFERIFNAMLNIPTLKLIRTSGLSSDVGEILGPNSTKKLRGQFDSLDTVELTACIVDLDAVIELVSACSALKSFGCEWAFLNCVELNRRDLTRALAAHKDTLEHLQLDAREVRFFNVEIPLEAIGSLRDFPCLNTVAICEMSLLANLASLLDFPDQQFSERIAELLPPTLQLFTLFVNPQDQEDGCTIDDIEVLWDLAEDCQQLLPALKEIRLASPLSLQAKSLTAQFNSVGVKLSLVEEVDLPGYNAML